MATLLDELVIRLGLDASGFRRGSVEAERDLSKTKERTVRGARDIEDAGKRAANYYTKLRNEVLALFALFVTARGMKEFISQTINSEAALLRFSRVTGMSVKELSAWQKAAEYVGGSAGAVGQSIQSIALKKITPEGMTELLKPLRVLGIQFDIYKGTITEFLETLHKAFTHLTPAQGTWLAQQLGLDPGLVTLLTQTDEKFNELMKTAQRYAVTQEQAEKGTELQQQILALEDALGQLGREILTSATPAIISVIHEMRDWADANRPWIEQNVPLVARDIADAMRSIPWSEIGSGARAVAADINAVAQALGGWKNAVELLLGVWVASKFAPMLGILGALRAAAVGGGAAAGAAIGSGTSLAAKRAAFGVGAAGAGLGALGFFLWELLHPTPAGEEPGAVPAIPPGVKLLPGVRTLGPGERPRPDREQYGPPAELSPGPVPTSRWGPGPLPSKWGGAEDPRSSFGWGVIKDVVSLVREGLVRPGWEREAGLEGARTSLVKGTRDDPVFIKLAETLADTSVGALVMGLPGVWGQLARTGAGVPWASRPGVTRGGTGGPGPEALPAAPVADLTMTPERRGFLAALSGGEASRYDIKQGGSRFGSYAQFPEGIGPKGISTAAGRYQFVSGTWHKLQQRLHLPDFSPVSQDKAAWYLASQTYREQTGRDLGADLKAGGHEAGIARALNKVWPSLPGGSQQNTTMERWLQRMRQGAPPGSAPEAQHPMRPGGSIYSDLKHASGVSGARAASTVSHGPVDNSVEAHTAVNGPITIHTAARDADGVARGLRGALQRYAYVTAVNTGLT